MVFEFLNINSQDHSGSSHRVLQIFQYCRSKRSWANIFKTHNLFEYPHWQHLEELPENSIAKQCLEVSHHIKLKNISKYRKSFLYLFSIPNTLTVCKEGINTTGIDDVQQIRQINK